MSWKQFEGYYVYTYLDENSKPYYVGMGCKNRVIAKHLYVSVPAFENIIVEDNLTQQQAWDREVELIALYGRDHLGTGSLKNLTAGGPTQKSGWAQSPSAKRQISIKNTGKVRTEDHKKNYRKPKSADHIDAIRKANLGRADDGRYVKTSQTMKGRPWSEARRLAQQKKIIKEI